MTNIILKLRRSLWYLRGRRKIKKAIRKAASAGKVKIIIGSGGTQYDGWIATDLPHFNVLKDADWRYFSSISKIDNLLAEHVLEHLTEKQVEEVLKLAFKSMKSGACFRIAVPDGSNPDPTYIDNVSPDGKMGSLYGHKFLWNYSSLKQLAEKIGFNVDLVEYHDMHGNFVYNKYMESEGKISRSFHLQSNVTELSLIIDCKK